MSLPNPNSRSYQKYPDGVSKRIVLSKGKYYWQRENSDELMPYKSQHDIWPGASAPRSFGPSQLPTSQALQQYPSWQGQSSAERGRSALEIPIHSSAQAGYASHVPSSPPTQSTFVLRGSNPTHETSRRRSLSEESTSTEEHPREHSQHRGQSRHEKHTRSTEKNRSQKQDRPKETSSTSRLPSSLGLPQDVIDFIAIPKDAFRQCATFFSDHQRFARSVDPLLLEKAAFHARNTKQTDLYFRCVQRLVIIQECRRRQLDTYQQQDYLDSLHAEDPVVRKKFYQDYNEIDRRLDPETSLAPPQSNLSKPPVLNESHSDLHQASYSVENPSTYSYAGKLGIHQTSSSGAGLIHESFQTTSSAYGTKYKAEQTTTAGSSISPGGIPIPSSTYGTIQGGGNPTMSEYSTSYKGDQIRTEHESSNRSGLPPTTSRYGTSQGGGHPRTSEYSSSYKGEQIRTTTETSTNRSGPPPKSSGNTTSHGGGQSTSSVYNGRYGGEQSSNSGYGSSWPHPSSPFNSSAPTHSMSHTLRPVAGGLTMPKPQVSSKPTYTGSHLEEDDDSRLASGESLGYGANNTGGDPGPRSESTPHFPQVRRPSVHSPPTTHLPKHARTPSEVSISESGYYTKIPSINGPHNADITLSETIDTTKLKPGYNLKNGHRFFERGRVFSVMFPEPMGINPKETKKKQAPNPNVVEGLKGEKIFCHIKRFVVIKRRHGYSLCIPINSYQSQGVKRKAEQNAHSIVYDSELRRPPSRFKEETEMTKTPIAVDLNRGHKLDPASRIHFGRITSIEWNVKVLDIGRVARSSMPTFEQYWKDELLL